MQKLITRYGSMAAMVLIVLGLINWLFIFPLGYFASEIGGYISILASCSMIFLGIRYYRDQVNQGQLRFGEGFRIGFFISLFPAILMFFVTALIFMNWGEEFMSWSDAYMQENLSASDYAAQQEKIADMGPIIQNPWFQGMVMFVTVLFIGLIVTLISSLLLRRGAGK